MISDVELEHNITFILFVFIMFFYVDFLGSITIVVTDDHNVSNLLDKARISLFLFKYNRDNQNVHIHIGQFQLEIL